LIQFEKESSELNQKRSDYEKSIAKAKKDLEKIKKQLNESEEMQQQGSTREEYFKIKSQIQIKNA